ncbi:MAG: RNA 2',3'-cyclic phosphodiesterase [Lachnospiraceae bacterium]|nr:RNA 2',3'-cyclic phosphodiesterase [Lachnospiraceae bacterium]
MRLFAAIQLSDECKRSLTGMMHELKKQGVKGSYVPVQNLHLTLAFIGETDDPGAVKDALKNVSVKPFRLAMTQPGVFGDILWMGVKGNQGLSGAAKAVRDALEEAGISYDRKKFEPHITLVRKVSGNWKNAAVPKGEMMVKKISLMKSSVRDGKRVYTEVMSV